MPLSPCQEKASNEFEAFLADDTKKTFILSGFSGVGKTYITKELLKLLDQRNKFMREILGLGTYTLALTATTNKAVRVLQSLIEELNIDVPVGTIYSFLGLTVKKDYKSGAEYVTKTKNTKVHKNTIVFIDEASYADDKLKRIVNECFHESKVVWIGDKDQLLSVNCSVSPIFDQITDESYVHMVTPQRNIGSINKLAHEYRNVLYGADWPIIKPTNEIHLIDGPTFQSSVEKMFYCQDYFDDSNFVKILGWTNQKVSAYNEFIRKMYTTTDYYVPNEYLTSNSAIISGELHLLSSDTTLKIKDASPVYEDNNGIEYQHISFYGFEHVLRVPIKYEQVYEALKVFAKNTNWHDYFHYKELYADMRPSHACTVHKSQGSTFKNVFIDLNDIGKNNKPKEVARLLYVAISRAKENVYLYGKLPDKYTGS